MVRLDFCGRAKRSARALRVAVRREPGVAIVAEAGPRLPFRDTSVDELFVDRAIARRTDIAATLDEFWRVCKPGALVHLTLPHASSVLAVTRDPRAQPLLTLETFNYYDPRTKPADAPTPAAFTVERARLRLAGHRGGDAGLALARGPLAGVIEKLANGSRGSQYRFERWFAQWFGGFEEFDVVLAVVKEAHRRQRGRTGRAEPAGVADPTTLRVTSDVAHEAVNVEPDPLELQPDRAPAEGPTGATLPTRARTPRGVADVER